MRCYLAIAAIVALGSAAGEVVDRVAVAVGTQAVKEVQIERDLRITEFLNGTPLDLSPQARRKAADRLIDQALIRRAMAQTSYPQPTAEDTGRVLNKIRQTRFRTAAEYQDALRQYGITEQDLKTEIAWQIAVLRFIDLRFTPVVRTEAVKNAKGRSLGDRVNDAFFAWLDDARKHARIQFHDEVFR